MFREVSLAVKTPEKRKSSGGNGRKAPAVTSWNAEYVDELYQQWQEDPGSLSESWQMFFKGFDLAMCPRACVANQAAHSQSQVASLIYAYRSEGHMIAQIDPLGDNAQTHPDLEIEQFGFSEEDLDSVYDTGHLGGPSRAPLRDILKILQDTYCRSIGVQYTHIQDKQIRRWLQAEMEPIRNRPTYDEGKKLAILNKLVNSELFETFTQTRYRGQKRFSLEGAETLIALLHELVEITPAYEIVEVVMGMSHRGRLNVLANILDKEYAQIFEEFEDDHEQDAWGGDGDVKYHKGFSSTHYNRDGHKTHLTLTANPSHLEAVDPVVMGRTRAKQRQWGDADERRKVLPILMHGDAAFSGQGMVAETLNLSQLKGYKVGGTIHVIVNNQIGFTTDPKESRSTAYTTDIAKTVEAPIFHVNFEDPEAAVYIAELALKFRQTWGRDVVIDMICYRKHGHNEGDEPSFTQPLMYEKIKKHDSVREIYTKQLLDEGVITREDMKRTEKEMKEILEEDLETARSSYVQTDPEPFSERWEGLDEPFSNGPWETRVSRENLLQAAKALTTVPPEFNLNRKIERNLKERMQAVEEDGDLDWGFAELLAFGTLLQDGNAVRLSGQDSERGTFSSRHSVWHDAETMEAYKPLNHIRQDQARFCVYNSPLSEASVLGFDYGYSLSEPGMLILWEAQFGDFANGAQVIIDQFITSSQSKWHRTSGLVMLLPHGYEGMGPEHSNAYLERYLSACAQNNIQVCSFTTPAQYFHALRRQMKRPFRLPLIVMSPKSLLRHKLVVSPVEDFVEGRFREILNDPKPPAKAKRLILCSGKIFYDLYEAREEKEIEDVALVRVEQFYPFNNEMLTQIVNKYGWIREIVWAQEETKNRGGWNFMRPLLHYLFPEMRIRYVGRGYAASPATGSASRHRQEQQQIIDAALGKEKFLRDYPVLPEELAFG